MEWKWFLIYNFLNLLDLLLTLPNLDRELNPIVNYLVSIDVWLFIVIKVLAGIITGLIFFNLSNFNKKIGLVAVFILFLVVMWNIAVLGYVNLFN